MDGDKLSFLDESKAAETEAPEPEQAEQVEAEPEQEVEAQPETGEKVEEPKAEEPKEEPKPEEKAAPPAADGQHVPLNSLLDEREKRQTIEREKRELEKRLQEMEAKNNPERKPPDMFEDPESWQRYQQQQVVEAQWNTTLNTSEMIARSQVGDEAVDAAVEAFQQAAPKNPGLVAELNQQQHPYQYLVDWHKRQSFMSEIGNDPEAYKQSLREQLKAELLAEMQSGQPAPAQAPPRSLATAPSAGGDAANSRASGSAFDQLFPE